MWLLWCTIFFSSNCCDSLFRLSYRKKWFCVYILSKIKIIWWKWLVYGGEKIIKTIHETIVIAYNFELCVGSVLLCACVVKSVFLNYTNTHKMCHRLLFWFLSKWFCLFFTLIFLCLPANVQVWFRIDFVFFFSFFALHIRNTPVLVELRLK